MNFRRSKLSKFVVLLLTLFFVTNCSAQTFTLKKKEISPDFQKLEVPKVYLGGDNFSPKRIYRSVENEREKQIIGLYAGPTDRQKVTNIFVATDEKGYIMDSAGNEKKEFNFRFKYYSNSPRVKAEKIQFASVKDIDGEGNVEILGNTVLISAIFDLQGNIVWKYKNGAENGNFYKVLVGDIDDYGKDEVIAVTDKKIEVFDADGELKWSKDLPVAEDKKYSFSDYYIQVGNFVGDEKKEILVGKTLFDNKGEIIGQNKVRNFAGFLNDPDGKPLLGKFENNQLLFFDIEGIEKEKYNSPLSSLKRKSILPNASGYGLTEAKFVRAKLFDKDKRALIVLATAFDQELFQRFHILYIYDEQGKLIYLETLRSLRSEIAVLPAAAGTEKLLLSTDGKLNLYGS